MASRLGYLGYREAELRRVRARSWRCPRERPVAAAGGFNETFKQSLCL